ncbi:MAG: FtsW/RodA/SpoVE family cell cycle protein [Patescibacteria group bacterium]
MLPKFDWVQLGAMFVLVAFGLAAIYSVALSAESGDLQFFQKQLVVFGIGVVLIVFMALSNYRLFRNWAFLLYLIGLLLLVGVLLFGTTVRGTTGWFRLLDFRFNRWSL